MSFAVGTTVRVKSTDPDHHTRVPRYVRGHTGEIVAAIDRWPMPARPVAPNHCVLRSPPPEGMLSAVIPPLVTPGRRRGTRQARSG